MPLVDIVLVPGLGCTSSMFDALLPALKARGPVTIADVLRDHSIARMAQRLLVAAPDRFVAVGFSMGGFVIAAVLEQAPERVQGLAFVSTSPRPDSAEQTLRRRELIGLIDDGRFDEIVDRVLPGIVGPELGALWGRMSREVGSTIFRRQVEAIIGRNDFRGTLAAAACPVSVIHGTRDRMVPVERAEEFVQIIPHAELALIDGGGHLVICERPRDVIAPLEALLDRTLTC